MRKTKKQIEYDKLAKALYDAEYRRINAERIRAEKAAYFQRTYNPTKAAIERKKKMHNHIEYCRQPEYRKWKSAYDNIYRSKKIYGVFWESMILVRKIQKIVCQRVPDIYERLKMRGHIRRMIMKKAHKRSFLYGWQFNYSEV